MKNTYTTTKQNNNTKGVTIVNKTFNKIYNVSKPGNRKPNEVKLPVGTYRANTSKIYFELKSALNTRHQLDEEYKRRWQMVKNGRPQPEAMRSINERIGNQTHLIDGIIAKLAKDRRDKAAVKMALDYLHIERSRVDGIIRSWQRTISLVERGKKILINEYGNKVSDTKGSKDYIVKKQHRLNRIDQMIASLRR